MMNKSKVSDTMCYQNFMGVLYEFLLYYPIRYEFWVRIKKDTWETILTVPWNFHEASKKPFHEGLKKISDHAEGTLQFSFGLFKSWSKSPLNPSRKPTWNFWENFRGFHCCNLKLSEAGFRTCNETRNHNGTLIESSWGSFIVKVPPLIDKYIGVQNFYAVVVILQSYHLDSAIHRTFHRHEYYKSKLTTRVT